MKVTGATPGIRCAAKTLDQWCSRDAGHPGAHQSRHPTAFRGAISWWNEVYLRPWDPEEAAIDRLRRMAAGYFG